MRQEDFARLYREHAAGLYGFLSYRAGDRATAEDLVSETFERAFRARLRFDRRKGTEKRWLYSIALNCARDHARRRAVDREAHERLDALPAPAAEPDPLEALGERDSMLTALAALPEGERDAVVLRYVSRFTAAEVGRIVGESTTTVEGRVYRGLRRLRTQLGAERAELLD